MKNKKPKLSSNFSVRKIGQSEQVFKHQRDTKPSVGNTFHFILILCDLIFRFVAPLIHLREGICQADIVRLEPLNLEGISEIRKWAITSRYYSFQVQPKRSHRRSNACLWTAQEFLQSYFNPLLYGRVEVYHLPSSSSLSVYGIQITQGILVPSMYIFGLSEKLWKSMQVSLNTSKRCVAKAIALKSH